MSFETYEESREQGGPVQLYLFRYGESGEHFAYTSHTQELTVDHGGTMGEIVYYPIPIDREGFSSDGTLDKSTLKVSMDIGIDLAELFRIYPPSSVVTLTIFEGHLDDPDGEFLAVWAGRIVAAGREKSELQVSAEPISTQLRRPGLRRNYQYGCPHALYSPPCGADKESATNTATVATISGATVTLEAGWEGYFDATKFLRGLLEWTNESGSTDRRTIIRISGDTLSLSGLPVGLAELDSVNVVLGCNHKPFAPDGDCQALHDNILNFGGQPWIPLKNVVKTNPYY